MSRTGWGLREFSDVELALCFELPDYVTWEDRFLRDIVVPLQLFRSVIEFVAGGIDLRSPRTKRVHQSDNESHVKAADVVWLEPI